MYSVLIISDSHGLTYEIEEIKTRHQCEYMIHCGDSELPADASVLQDFITVKGNCDYHSSYKLEQVIQIGGLKFLITHGHLYQVKSNLNALAYRADELSAQVICFGHSHVAGALKEANQLFINPGSIYKSRERIEKTYVIMEWDTVEHIDVTFYTLAGEKIEALQYTAALTTKFE